jgi:hypothetical protein
VSQILVFEDIDGVSVADSLHLFINTVKECLEYDGDLLRTLVGPPDKLTHFLKEMGLKISQDSVCAFIGGETGPKAKRICQTSAPKIQVYLRNRGFAAEGQILADKYTLLMAIRSILITPDDLITKYVDEDKPFPAGFVEDYLNVALPAHLLPSNWGRVIGEKKGPRFDGTARLPAPNRHVCSQHTRAEGMGQLKRPRPNVATDRAEVQRMRGVRATGLHYGLQGTATADLPVRESLVLFSGQMATGTARPLHAGDRTTAEDVHACDQTGTREGVRHLPHPGQPTQFGNRNS